MRNVKNTTLAFSAILFMFLSCFSPLTAKETKEKIKSGIESVSDELKNLVDKFVDKKDEASAAIQNYFDQYSWQGLIQDKASTGVATLEHFKMNGHHRAITAKPGEKIECKIKTYLDPAKCADLSFYRIIIGIKGEGPQTTICNYPGLFAGESKEKFTLRAPSKPGLYEVRFRPVESFTSSDALDNWYDWKGQEPDATTTIGVIYVK